MSEGRCAQLPVARILDYPHPLLRQVSRPIPTHDEPTMRKVRELVMAMRATMHDRGGIGLAAIQIGVPARVLIVHVPGEMKQPMAFVNPEIVDHSAQEVEAVEGCLSFRMERDLIVRHTSVVVSRHDEHGHADMHEFRGLVARVIQHEIDHLDGVLLIDKLPKARARMMERRLKAKFEKRRQAPTAA